MFTLPNDRSKFSAKWKYVEFARARISGNKAGIYRLQDKSGSPLVFSVDDIQEELDKNGDIGFYTSVWQYDTEDFENGKRMSSLYFDLDHKDDPTASHTDAKKLMDYLKQFIPRSALHFYFTGLKGFHIEVEALAVGITPSVDNHVNFRYIANKLKDELDLNTLDFAVYDARRMWRYPNTRHQKSMLYKVEIFDDEMSFDDITKYAEKPRELYTEEQTLDYNATKWYRDLTFKREEEAIASSMTPAERMQNFAKYGSTTVRLVHGDDKDFDPKRLMDSCHTIGDLWDKAERTGHLEHEERLFLCSILSYTPESLDYLYAILSNCSDFNPNVSKIHIEDWIRRRDMGIGGKPYSCKTANEKGFGCMDCDLEQKPKYIKQGNILIQTGELAAASPVRFAYSRKGKGY